MSNLQQFLSGLGAGGWASIAGRQCYGEFKEPSVLDFNEWLDEQLESIKE